MNRTFRLVLGIFFIGLWGWAATAPLSAHHAIESVTGPDNLAVALPSNFIARTVVSGLTLPTDMVILPSGDFLVTEKGIGSGVVSTAQVRLVRAGILQPTPALTIGVNSEEDSGLMGIILDPQFATNHYFYLWYSTGEDSVGWQGISYNRLSRFVFDEASGLADPASETIILDKVSWASIHNGGGLAFDDAGNLLITTGDAGSSIVFPDTNLAQKLDSLNGKVLRIRPRVEGGYDIPGDNPFVTNTMGFRPEIYASGLRNPFRIARRAADQQFYVVEVGQDTWEEVDRLQAGANYGWPFREGKCAIFERGPTCTPNPGGFTDPDLVYIHPTGSGAGITAIAFYQGTKWPQQYRDRLFFADFNLAWIGMFNLNTPDSNYLQFATDANALVDMEATNEGIYAVSIYDQSIKFIYYDEESNHPPTAVTQVAPTSGKAPLQVNFAATAQDVDHDDLFYQWNFGDSVVLTTPAANVSHVYTRDGTYLATLQVIDEDDGRSEFLSQVVQVYSGELATIAVDNITEPGRILYQGGDQFRFRAVRNGDSAGLDPTAPYAWTILLHHNEHAHVLMAGYVSNETVLDIPLHSHALGVPLWYEVQLTMHTDSGQKIQTIYEVRPQTTTIQLQSWPGQSVLKLNQQQRMPTELTTVIAGQEYTLEAPEFMIFEGKVGQFKNWVVTDSWSTASIAGGTQTIEDRQFSLVAAADPKTYIAFYEAVGVANRIFLPSIAGSFVVGEPTSPGLR
jgi:glucose/arabinose dehydrogenase